MAADNQQGIKQAIERIHQLMSEENWNEAHRATLEILQYDPDNLKIIHLKNKVEKQVRNFNRKAIKDDLKQLEPLRKERRFAELLQYLSKLEPYVSDYPPLQRIILKTKQEYEKEQRGEKEQLFTENFKKIENLYVEKKFSEALLFAEQLRTFKIHEEKVKQLIKKIRFTWINEEISKNEVLISSDKYEDTLLFLYKTQKIDQNSQKLMQLIESVKKRYQRFKVDEKREFIYQSLEEIRTLYQLKKYEKAIEACEEIINIDFSNKIANSFLRKSKKNLERKIDKEARQQMIASHKQMAADIKASQESRENYQKI